MNIANILARQCLLESRKVYRNRTTVFRVFRISRSLATVPSTPPPKNQTESPAAGSSLEDSSPAAAPSSSTSDDEKPAKSGIYAVMTELAEIEAKNVRKLSAEERNAIRKAKDEAHRDGVWPADWNTFFLCSAMMGLFVGYIWYRQKQTDEMLEKKEREVIGKSLIGGPWELINCSNGKVETEEDWLGKWYLIYFGFTHCPDICPDELNKMINVAKRVEKDKNCPEQIVPVMFSVDPHRDTVEEVKKYCLEFSKDLIGFTGTVDQVKKVAKTFRVYFSEGPKDEFNDYIVDHSVIMYLMDPRGNFIDYFGQNKSAPEILDSIRTQMAGYQRALAKNWDF